MCEQKEATVAKPKNGVLRERVGSEVGVGSAACVCDSSPAHRSARA